MGFALFVALIFTAMLLPTSHSESQTLEEALARETFEKSFVDRCSKYPFVQRYWDNLETPSEKFVVFVFHEHGLRNGGLGDRLGGLISATAIALRLNRTLLIQASNGFEHLFRPYRNPVTAQKAGPDQYVDGRYTYSNWTSWTKYNPELSNHDETEYDLYFCINTMGTRNNLCAIDSGDVSQPIIKMRANRAYLCHWMNLADDNPAYEELLTLGVNRSTDLLEVAGCMLRLAMWPTDMLWAEVGKILKEEMNVLRRPAAGADPAVTDLPYLVGMHFRCGDRSYMRGDDKACIHDPAIDVHASSETVHMTLGTPIDIGQCAHRVISDRLSSTSTSTSLPAGRQLSVSSTEKDTSATDRLLQQAEQQQQQQQQQGLANVFAYIASDNQGSSEQMRSYASWNNSYISPHGCHVELDPSAKCTLLTVAYWTVLSLSDSLVAQSERGCPISAFSRYAASYGLKGSTSLLNGKDCVANTSFNMSHTQAGNWFC